MGNGEPQIAWRNCGAGHKAEFAPGTLFIYLIGDYMNSPIKLPPLPEPRIVSYQVDSILRYTELRTYDDADMRAYAEQAVRDALAAQVPVAACLPGYGCTIVSTDLDHLGRNGWRGLAIIPENNHE